MVLEKVSFSKSHPMLVQVELPDGFIKESDFKKFISELHSELLTKFYSVEAGKSQLKTYLNSKNTALLGGVTRNLKREISETDNYDLMKYLNEKIRSIFQASFDRNLIFNYYKHGYYTFVMPSYNQRVFESRIPKLKPDIELQDLLIHDFFHRSGYQKYGQITFPWFRMSFLNKYCSKYGKRIFKVRDYEDGRLVVYLTK